MIREIRTRLVSEDRPPATSSGQWISRLTDYWPVGDTIECHNENSAMQNVFSTDHDDLPDELPLFPLSGAVLLPNGQLPLNIFETRYLNMVLDALAGPRMIGMVQPLPGTESDLPELHLTGCAGRVVSFNETRDDRLLIVLGGVCRFDIVKELDVRRGYRQSVVNWERFAHDLDQERDLDLEKKGLLDSVRRYLEQRNLSVEWEVLKGLEIPELVDTLGCSLPFSPREKQGLVEALILRDRYDLVSALCEFGTASLAEASPRSH